MLIPPKYDIICPECGRVKMILDPAQFFNTPGQSCDKCGTIIQTGQMGLEEQIVLSVSKGKSIFNAVKMYQLYHGVTLAEANRAVGEFLVRKNIPFRPVSVSSRPVIFILAIVVALAVMGFIFLVVFAKS
jgi:hypothetical protein